LKFNLQGLSSDITFGWFELAGGEPNLSWLQVYQARIQPTKKFKEADIRAWTEANYRPIARAANFETRPD